MRRIGLYSLIAFASLVLVGLLVTGIGGAPGQADDAPVEKANTPTVAEPPEPAPETTSEETAEEPSETEKEAEERKAAEEQEAAERAAAEQAAVQKEWREIAEQRAAEREAAEQAAAEQRVAEQEAAEQAAAEQRAAEQEAAEQAAAEQRAAEQAAAAEQRAAVEQEAAQTAVPTSTALNLTVPKIGIRNNPVTNSVSESVLANGAGKLPSTGFPWQEGANTYIAAHVYGYPGTGSWQQFAGLPNMVQGDQIFLTDSGGTTYEYRVSEILTVAPTDVWVAEPTGQSMVSLQTCVGPGWSERLVVRGTLVGTTPA